ncbi:MAG TPA: hypothetical protein DFI01_03000 [Bacteroidales bacterium]|nr:hypothetical protein [Bacteroidales bacterium]
MSDMKKISKIQAIFILLMTSFITEAQIQNPRRLAPSSLEPELWKMRRYELVAGLGITQFFGDIGGYSIGENAFGFKDLSFHHTRFNMMAALKYRITNSFTARLNLAGGFFHATDARGSNVARGFESSTAFFESSLLGEYYFIRSKRESSYIFLKGKRIVLLPLLSTMNLYAFGGIGGLAYSVNNQNIDSPTGKTKPGGFTAVIPAGVGVSMAYSARMNFGVELGGRYSFSDYIDGYTSIYSKANDVYYFLTFTLSVKLPTVPK